jgi:glycosyltransferase involved in cell wall biosynthesis
MRIVALVASPDHVCARYRVAAFRAHLERAGHSFAIRTFPRIWWSRWLLGRELAQADVVIVQRRLFSTWHLQLLRRHVQRLVFDFDDAVFLRDSYDPRGMYSRRRLHDFAVMMRACDAVVAGNDYLREQALHYTTPDRLQVIPTCVEPSLYPVADHTRGGAAVRLVWIGSASTLQGLVRIRPVLEQLGARLPGLRLKLICDQTLELRSLPVDFCPWSERNEARDLASADIGISWLPADRWSQGKCGLKVLQYMAAGLPVVANRVGVQADFVEHGVSGYLADSTAEWLDAVGRLKNDLELRRRQGAAGRRRVERDFPVELGAALWLEALERLMQRPPLFAKEAA